MNSNVTSFREGCEHTFSGVALFAMYELQFSLSHTCTHVPVIPGSFWVASSEQGSCQAATSQVTENRVT